MVYIKEENKQTFILDSLDTINITWKSPTVEGNKVFANLLAQNQLPCEAATYKWK